jgi:hypothetical protein
MKEAGIRIEGMAEEMKEAGIRIAGTAGAIGIKERQHKPARRRPGVTGNPEFYVSGEIGKFTV